LVPFALLNHQQQSNGDDSQYAACLYYAPIPMKEFLSHAQNNHELNEPQSLETWTPQCSPPPEEECGTSAKWDRQVETLATWTPQYTPPPEEECGPCDKWFVVNDNFSKIPNVRG
jgi:hypothetical protein